MKQAIKEFTVFKEEMTEVFIDGKNTMPVSNINQLEGHVCGAFHGILISTGRTETAVTAERNKFKLSTVGATVHGTTKRGITTVDHFIDIFHLGFSGMKSIFNFFIIVGENFL